LYSLSLQGLIDQVKSTRHTIDHFGSVKYAELLDPVEGNANSNSTVPFAAVSYQKFIFLAVSQLTEVTTVKITV